MSAASIPAETARAIQAIEKKVLDEETVPLIQDRFELDQLLDQLRRALELQAEAKPKQQAQAAKDARDANGTAAQQAAQGELRLRQAVTELSRKVDGISREQRSLGEALRRQAGALQRLETAAGRGRPGRFLMGFGLGMSMVPGIFFLFYFLLTLLQRGAKYASISLLALLGGLGCIVLGLLLFAGAGLLGMSGRRKRKDNWEEDF